MAAKYQCAECQGIFEMAISDDEAKAEFKKLWGFDPPPDSTSIVCDDCYEALLKRLEN